jgi:chromosome segregation ATPase
MTSGRNEIPTEDFKLQAQAADAQLRDGISELEHLSGQIQRSTVLSESAKANLADVGKGIEAIRRTVPSDGGLKEVDKRLRESRGRAVRAKKNLGTLRDEIKAINEELTVRRQVREGG